MSDGDEKQSLESFLNPSILRSNLIVVALYIAAFELLRDSIVDRLVEFYATSPSYDKNPKPLPGPDYETEVLQGRKKVPASLAWLKKSDVIDESDIEKFNKAEELRNTLVHEMSHILWNGLPSDLSPRFSDMFSLLEKIERWWTINVDMDDVNSERVEVDERSIMPGRVLGLRLLMEIAIGSEEESRKYLDEFIRLKGPATPEK